MADLASGDLGPWRTVKRPKGVERAVLIARVGPHHRIRFNIDGDRLRVLEMIPRVGLDVALKRLRAIA